MPGHTTARPLSLAATPMRVAVRSAAPSSHRPDTTPPEPTEAVSPFVLRDRQNDVEVASPPYADIVDLRIDASGGTIAVSVDLAATVPSSLAKGETLGVGVDLGPPDAKDATYQLFADGGRRGWFAYLDTPHGLVKYPGTFDVSGPRIAFRVPLKAVGGLRRGSVSAFCDWSRRGLAAGQASTDDVPDDGRREY